MTGLDRQRGRGARCLVDDGALLARRAPRIQGSSSGIGFAIPVNSVRGLVTQILTYGRVGTTHRQTGWRACLPH
jgi:S1-C subfamily serine protease